MRLLGDRLDALARLHLAGDDDERRALFRQAFATLAQLAGELRPAPLEGLDGDQLVESVRSALQTALLDDLTWISPAHSAAALYELASALPPCDEKRDLGRRVLVRLMDGDAATFVLVATQLAVMSKRGLSGAPIRARVALALDLPIGSGLGVDALALALISRRDLEAEWLSVPSQGALPSRRLAARLLERAAREISRRVATGDESPLQVLDRASVEAAWQRLLHDREPLVWRHVASARGLLAGIVPRFDEEIAAGLRIESGVSEWRRAATSLASTLSFEPERAMKRCEEFLSGPVAAKDPGIASAVIYGLARPLEAEPAAAEKLLVRLVQKGGVDALEALLAIREEHLGEGSGEWTAKLALVRLEDPEIVGMPGVDDGHDALRLVLASSLTVPGADSSPGLRSATLLDLLAEARRAFLEADAKAAHAASFEILAGVEASLQRLEESRESTAKERREAFATLRELDAVLFETSTLVDLLTLDVRDGRDEPRTPSVEPKSRSEIEVRPLASMNPRATTTTKGRDELRTTTAGRSRDEVRAALARSRHGARIQAIVARLQAVLLARETHPVTSAEVPHPTLRVRRLRVLLHLVDADVGAFDDRSQAARERKLHVATVLLARARVDVRSPLRRILHAAAARACEAVLRDEIVDLSDVLVAVINHLHSDEDLVAFAEATMLPESDALFRAYARLVTSGERQGKSIVPRPRAMIDGLKGLVRAFPPSAGPRVDALRLALLRLASALDDISQAGSLSEIVGEIEGASELSRIAILGDACETLARLCGGALRRMNIEMPNHPPTVGASLRVLDLAALHSLRRQQSSLADALMGSIEAAREELPRHIAKAIEVVLAPLADLPLTAPRRSSPGTVRLLTRRDRGLPPWVPPSRSLGGFYILRSLSSGGVGSVFEAVRADERADGNAERFALKVPEFAGSAARTLSEDRFLQLFREEAGALLAVPTHPNLARLVTFDAGARPKPILVMELVEGPTLQRLLETEQLDVGRALATLKGIGMGLRAMHSVGVGHLDLKPSNVILRDIDGPGPAPEVPVLVDFGLAGRTVRPGCATANYGAPEVWGLVPQGVTPSPSATDIYAFGCLVYEVLVGTELFHADSEVAILTQHLQHDGDLPQLEPLLRSRAMQPIGEAVRAMLRKDPRKRLTIDGALQALESAAPRLVTEAWPLRAG